MQPFDFMAGDFSVWQQCTRRLWLQYRQPELAAASSEKRLADGLPELRAMARQHFDQALQVSTSDALRQTCSYRQQQPLQTLLDGRFVAAGMLVRADILQPLEQGGCRLINIRAGRGIKPYFYTELALQQWVLQQNGECIREIEVWTVDSGFEYPGGGDYRGLWQRHSISGEVARLLEHVPQWLQQMEEQLQQHEPEVVLGSQCRKPVKCRFYQHCHQQLRQQQVKYPLTVLNQLSGTLRDKLYRQGYRDARDVPEHELTPTQRWIQRLSRCEQAELKPAAARKLAGYGYPRYFLDFETVAYAIPRWPGTVPYRSHIPFQWSCHIQQADGRLQHQMFLDVSGEDPRLGCAQMLLATLGEQGSILVYNQAFEKKCIEELALQFAELAPALRALNKRVVDLLPLTQANYYHPQMMGSWSLKSVLPVVAPDLDYSGLSLVADGGDAQWAYQRLVGGRADEVECAALIQSLRRYCYLDTLALVRLADFLGAPDEGALPD